MDTLETLKSLNSSSTSSLKIDDWKQSCYDAMNDDFNSILIANIFEGVRFVNLINDNKRLLQQLI
jgi:cysteinyl-tRNA synthetase